MASWLINNPLSWRFWSYLAAQHRPCLTLIRGRPWEDTQ